MYNGRKYKFGRATKEYTAWLEVKVERQEKGLLRQDAELHEFDVKLQSAKSKISNLSDELDVERELKTTCIHNIEKLGAEVVELKEQMQLDKTRVCPGCGGMLKLKCEGCK